MPYDARAVLFDAGATLLLPTIDIADVYLREAEAIGAAPDPVAFRAHLVASWTRLRGAGPDAASLQTSEADERGMWHRFTAEVAAPFERLAARHAPWLERLVAWFDAPAAWTPAPGALDLLSLLRARGSKVGVVSNWHGALHRILEALGFTGSLDFVLISSEHGFRKPHASIFEAALKAAGTPAAAAVHVGDALRDDVAGALGAGIRAILVAAERPAALPHGVRWVPDLRSLLPPGLASRHARGPE